MRLLALDAALARCSAAVLAAGAVAAERRQDGQGGEAALLPALVRAVLADAGLRAAELDAIAVTVGPGSFTGLRAALALAEGLSLAAGVPLVGVTVPEALAEAAPAAPGRTLWVAIDSRRQDRVFLAAEGALRAVTLAALPLPATPVALAGDAAPAVAEALAARGADVRLTAARLPCAVAVARVALRRLAGTLPPLAAHPLYLDAPAIRPPAGAPCAAPHAR